MTSEYATFAKKSGSKRKRSPYEADDLTTKRTASTGREPQGILKNRKNDQQQQISAQIQNLMKQIQKEEPEALLTQLKQIKNESSRIVNKLGSSVPSTEKYVNTEDQNLFSFTKGQNSETMSEENESKPQSDHRMSKMRNIKSEINALMNQIDTKKQIFEIDEVESNSVFGVESQQVTMNFQKPMVPPDSDFQQSEIKSNFQQSEIKPNFQQSEIKPNFQQSEIKPNFHQSEIKPKLQQSELKINSDQNHNLDLNSETSQNKKISNFQQQAPRFNPMTFAPQNPQHPQQPTVPESKFLELQDIAQNLSQQNQNLQQIAINQNVDLQNKDKQIFEMNEYILEIKTKNNQKIANIQNEIGQKLRMAQERLSVFENESEFEEVLRTYNGQMEQLQTQNENIINEMKKMKIEIPKGGEEKSEKMMEYNYKKLQAALKKLTQGLEKNSKELDEYRKKERIFNLHKRCAEDQSKKSSNFGKKISELSTEINEKNVLLLKMEQQIEQLVSEVENLQSQNKSMENQKQLNLEELKLLKDFVYGIDSRAKDIHFHKFGGNYQLQSFDTNKDIFNPVFDGSIDNRGSPKQTQKKLSKKFENVVTALQKGSRQIDPKILVANFKTEIELTESQFQKSKLIESKLLDLVTQIYEKLERNLDIFDPEVKKINKTLREILAQKQ